VSLSPRISLLLILLTALALSGTSRFAQGRRVSMGDGAHWTTTDPDTLYHARRVDRLLTEGAPVAATDPFLNFPGGSAIPWPAYYTYVASAFVAPFAPGDDVERRAFVEERVASLALVFGVLATLVACLAGFVLAGRPGALVAGSYQALCHIGIAYSKLGNGDHHSFVSFLSGALLLTLSAAMLRDRLSTPRTALAWGASAGVMIGVLLGSWVGGMMTVVQVELVLAWLIVRQARDGRAGLASFGLALHLSAVLVLMPAVLASPWTEVEPWMVVNLSWFHLAFLALGGLVFVPLLFLGEGSRALRGYPWVVAAALGALGMFFLFADVAVAHSIREGFDWASKTDSFMAGIRESRSLFAADADPGVSEELGFAFWLLPLAWAGGAWACFRRVRLELLPWVVSVPLLLLQAAQQARFAESLVLPMAVLLGWAAAQIFAAQGSSGLGRVGTLLRRPPALVTALLALVLVGLSHGSSTLRSLENLTSKKTSIDETPATLAVRQAARWLDRNTSTPANWSVLANWSHGHAIEWAADRPTVATNFGSYVGVDSFSDPSRFFMSEDPTAAEALLERRRARFVLVTSELPDNLESMIALSEPDQRLRWVDTTQEGRVLPAWFQTMGARLMFGGEVFMQDTVPNLDFLRLVYVSPILDPERQLRHAQDISPAAWIWERVPGARIEAYTTPGTTLRIWFEIEFPRAQRLVKWRGLAVVGEDGHAEVRVPYATSGTTWEGRVRRAHWRLGSFDGTLQVDEAAVWSGTRIVVHGSPPR
jgi:asparagine N-glycosylation enzyme membrane subunit Stt3